MEITELHKRSNKRLPPEQQAELVKKARKEYDKPCKGMFEFLDAQGGWLEFTERSFKDQGILTIKLIHGEICELPMGIVKRLNNTKKKIRKFGNVNGELPTRGLPTTYELQSRVRFTPVDYL
jgi:hypothetical protein